MDKNDRGFNKVAVVGAGQMGAGIAQVCAASGLNTLLYDSAVEQSKSALAAIEKRMAKAVDKEQVSKEDAEACLSRLSTSNSLAELSESDILIEAIIENTEIKTSLFKELDALCKKETVFASNTSSISITKLAAATSRPSQVIGIHFMNPVPIMELVEIIRGLQTSEEVYQNSLEFCKRLGKTTVTARCDYPGFIVNRILIPMLNEAVFVLMEGIATPEEIDTAMKLGTRHPMGPLQLADFVGLDTCLAIAKIFHEELGEDKYRPCPLLTKYVEAGWLGKKVGRGFYTYD